MDSEAILRNLIGQIYDATLEPTLWPPFLDALAAAINCTGTGMYVQDLESQRANVDIAQNLDPTYLREYEKHYSKVNIFVTRGKDQMTPGRVFRGSEMCSEQALLRSEYYNDSLRRYDLFHPIGAVILQEGTLSSLITSWRRRSQGDFDPSDVALLQALVPHLRRAVQIHQRLDELTVERDAALESLDRLPSAVILTNERGDILFANRAAEEVVNRRDGLCVDHSGLTAATSRETARLRATIGRAALDVSGVGQDPGPLKLSRPSGRRDLALIVAPLVVRSRALLRGTRRVVAVFVADPERPSTLRGEHLQRLYGLTQTEAQLASLLASGLTLQDVCDRLGIRKNTGRWHLQRVFGKTSTNSQSGLIRLLVSGPATLVSR